MLVISRKKGESVLIGKDIEIVIVSIDDNNVKIAISAPREVKVLRKELLKEVTEENQIASQVSAEILEKLKTK